MDRKEVARILEEIAAMLELAGENPFKVRAYQGGARAVLAFPGDLAEAVQSGELRNVQGIGAGLFANIETLITTGALPFYEELRASFPPSLRDCLKVPGLGARKARLLYETLGIDSLEALEKACLEGRLGQVRGFGPASAEKILKGVALLRGSAGYHLFDHALARAEETFGALRRTGLAARLEIAGSLRRKKEIIRDMDFVAASRVPESLAEAFRNLPGVVEVTGSGDTKTSIRFADGLAADLRVVSEAEFPAALLDFTGSKEHNIALQGRARRMGLKLNEYGLFRTEDDGRLAGASEEEIYAAVGLPYIEPELREGDGEIEAAERGKLPVLVEEKDLRGLIHIHTTESDGRDTLEDMVAAVFARDYEYVAITDHSKSAAYARGLTEERALSQREQIRALRSRFPSFRIFHGTEADILADGTIDFGDEFLKVFDLVVASVHSRFGLPEEEQTRRLIRAVRNPLVSILGHPTGRLLLSRDPIAVDSEAVLDAAAAAGCAIEINSNPRRLDLDWRLCRRAKEKGVDFSIDPDAHSVDEVGLTRYGVGIARKGWVTAAAVLNAKGPRQVESWLEARRGGALATI